MINRPSILKWKTVNMIYLVHELVVSSSYFRSKSAKLNNSKQDEYNVDDTRINTWSPSDYILGCPVVLLELNTYDLILYFKYNIFGQTYIKNFSVSQFQIYPRLIKSEGSPPESGYKVQKIKFTHLI